MGIVIEEWELALMAPIDDTPTTPRILDVDPDSIAGRVAWAHERARQRAYAESLALADDHRI